MTTDHLRECAYRALESLAEVANEHKDELEKSVPDASMLVREVAEVVGLFAQIAHGDGVVGPELAVAEPSGRREFQGCRRWVLDEARKYRKGVERHGLIRAEAYEDIAKAMGDYWLGPE